MVSRIGSLKAFGGANSGCCPVPYLYKLCKSPLNAHDHPKVHKLYIIGMPILFDFFAVGEISRFL